MGKTACYSIGALNVIDENKKETQALIITPTNELSI